MVRNNFYNLVVIRFTTASTSIFDTTATIFGGAVSVALIITNAERIALKCKNIAHKDI